jgi:hypothetical protein
MTCAVQVNFCASHAPAGGAPSAPEPLDLEGLDYTHAQAMVGRGRHGIAFGYGIFALKHRILANLRLSLPSFQGFGVDFC